MLRSSIALLAAAMIGGLAGISSASASCAGPDPSVAAIKIGDIDPSRPGRFDFEITCVVMNTGNAPFVSTKRGQGIALFELKHGESEGHRLRYRRYADLDVGETLIIHKWIKDWPADQDFPSSFECKLVYDYEKRTDQDSRNDDCDLTNNRKIVRGVNMLQLFAQPAQSTLPIPAQQAQ